MAKKKIKDQVSDILAGYLEENGLELWNVEFVKEARDWFLRVYVDKKPGAEKEYVSIEECENVSRFLSEALDEQDPIEQNYYLEVSSPGLDRELITEDHYRRYFGSVVEMKLYKAIDGKKEISAVLDDMDDDKYYLTVDDGSKIEVEKSQVAKTRLAVII